MRIVQAVGWFYPDSWGGTEIYVDGLAHRLRAAGHVVAVAAPDPGHDVERSYKHGDIQVYRYPVPAEPTREEAQGGTVVRGAERFHRWMAAFRPDVVHVHTFVTGLGLAEVEAARELGARVIATTHAASLGFICGRGTMMRWGVSACDGIIRERECAACMLQHRGLARPLASATAAVPEPIAEVLSRLPGRAGRTFTLPRFIRDQRQRQRRLLGAVHRFVLLTEWAKQAVLANGAPADRLAVNRLGIVHQSPRRKPGPDERPTSRPVRIGYVGRFEAIKGADDFVRALVSIPPEVEFRAELIGPRFSPSDYAAVRTLRQQIGGDPRIVIRDPVPHSRMPQTLAELDLLCCPSVAAEGGPTVALEAHAVGTPVIGTRIGGLAELVTDGVNGRLVPPGDWRALAGAIAAVVADPATTIDRWRRALPSVRTLDDVTREYLALYAA